MSRILTRLFSRKSPARARSTGGRLIYAIGDVHGRLDLLDPLLGAILPEALAHPGPEAPMLVFLGDYVDRGPDSAGVIERVLGLQASGELEVRALKGNHEEALLAFLEDPAFGPMWFEHGGGTTLASYGVTPPPIRSDLAAWTQTRDAFADALPTDHLSFCETLELMVSVGDYVFVHAGIRPGVSLDRQNEKDLLWIRGEFLQAKTGFGKVIVHGHTPTENPQVTDSRIGLDTGAYATGTLSAVRLLDAECRIIQHSRAQTRPLSGTREPV